MADGPPLKFAFSDAKAIEVLAFVAEKWDGITPFFLAKVLFFAEKWHLNRYGRPIIADTYIAMPHGPVPSAVKNIVDENFEFFEEPETFRKMLRVERVHHLRHLHSRVKSADLMRLSGSDTECLEEAIAFCRAKDFGELSNLTHFEKAWKNAPANRPMAYEDFLDDGNPERDALLEEAKSFAAYGVL